MKKIIVAIRRFFTKKEKFVTDWPKNMNLRQYWDKDGNEHREWIPDELNSTPTEPA